MKGRFGKLFETLYWTVLAVVALVMAWWIFSPCHVLVGVVPKPKYNEGDHLSAPGIHWQYVTVVYYTLSGKWERTSWGGEIKPADESYYLCVAPDGSSIVLSINYADAVATKLSYDELDLR